MKMTLCQRLNRKRREFQLRQEDVAKYLGFESKNAYWSIENGRTKLRTEHLVLLMALYNVSAEYFLLDEAPKEKIL
ncbi:helix-turn-helix domain-containing protein [Succinispira mobilis]|uniref:helix-turn-helix domain-containing protein n=1 Tax=Succinispira mobilis TaxID=78120 RepID=UPI00037DE696|nr:helix-turn-helix transcriptional regulator [Succinispira mobilis]